MKTAFARVFAALFSLILATPLLRAADAPKPIAKVGDTVLTEDDLRKDAGMQLYQTELRLYTMEKGWVDQKAMEILFDKAAKKAGLSRAKWEAREIDAKVPPVDEEQVKKMSSQFMNQPGITPEQAVKNARDGLTNQAKQMQRYTVYQELAKATPVEMMIVRPEAPRINVAYSAANPSRGQAKAPVTLVEFTDYQCPYCSRAQGTLKEIEAAHPKDLKVVNRQFPLPFHNRAKPSAEAALCAHEQGKYWEFRDKLFGNQQALEDTDYRKYAKEIGLNESKFDKCLTSHKYAAQVDADIADGQKYGVTGTPAFFINGEMISGAQPKEAFEQAVQTALSKTK
jgi:protein-disulfide isomerase